MKNGGRKWCKSCKKSENQRYFAVRRSVHLASEIRRREKNAQPSCEGGEDEVGVDFTFVEAVVRRWGARCFVTGESRAVLTLIRVRADRPWAHTNAVPVTRRAARRLGGQLPAALHAEFDARLLGWTTKQPANGAGRLGTTE